MSKEKQLLKDEVLQLMREYPTYELFNEDALMEEVIRIWGPAGAHAEVLTDLIKDRDKWKARALSLEVQLTSLQAGIKKLRRMWTEMEEGLGR